ncbi:MAG: hypothetical protein RJA70_2049 [Pseudomonadota bacterium]|jgi:hypothetical protein
MLSVPKIVVLSLAAVTIAILSVGALLPREYRARQSLLIAGPPGPIYALVADFRQWEKWATKNSKADLSYRFEGPQGTGSVQIVSGARGGEGRMTLTRSDPNVGIAYATERDGQPIASGSIALEFSSGVTTVSWEERGNLPWIWGGFMRDPTEKQVSAYFGQALLALKDVVEASD